MGIAEEQLAQALSARGGLGLSGLIEQGLTKSTNATKH
jgi:Rod binding domain-containing protein